MNILNLVKFFVESLKSSLHPMQRILYLPDLVSGSLHPTNHNINKEQIMLGWWITVFSDADRQEPHLIASWECGIGGTDWLDELCQAGHAVQTENNGGYPNVYQTQAKHVAP